MMTISSSTRVLRVRKRGETAACSSRRPGVAARGSCTRINGFGFAAPISWRGTTCFWTPRWPRQVNTCTRPGTPRASGEWQSGPPRAPLACRTNRRHLHGHRRALVAVDRASVGDGWHMGHGAEHPPFRTRGWCSRRWLLRQVRGCTCVCHEGTIPDSTAATGFLPLGRGSHRRNAGCLPDRTPELYARILPSRFAGTYALSSDPRASAAERHDEDMCSAVYKISSACRASTASCGNVFELAPQLVAWRTQECCDSHGTSVPGFGAVDGNHSQRDAAEQSLGCGTRTTSDNRRPAPIALPRRIVTVMGMEWMTTRRSTRCWNNDSTAERQDQRSVRGLELPVDGYTPMQALFQWRRDRTSSPTQFCMLRTMALVRSGLHLIDMVEAACRSQS